MPGCSNPKECVRRSTMCCQHPNWWFCLMSLSSKGFGMCHFCLVLVMYKTLHLLQAGCSFRLLSESSEVQFWTFPHLLKLSYLLLVSIYNLSYFFFNQWDLFSCIHPYCLAAKVIVCAKLVRWVWRRVDRADSSSVSSSLPHGACRKLCKGRKELQRPPCLSSRGSMHVF